MKEALILIDTSIWIESFDKMVKPKVKGEMERLILEGRAAITPLVRLELLSGASTIRFSAGGVVWSL